MLQILWILLTSPNMLQSKKISRMKSNNLFGEKATSFKHLFCTLSLLWEAFESVTCKRRQLKYFYSLTEFLTTLLERKTVQEFVYFTLYFTFYIWCQMTLWKSYQNLENLRLSTLFERRIVCYKKVESKQSFVLLSKNSYRDSIHNSICDVSKFR